MTATDENEETKLTKEINRELKVKAKSFANDVVVASYSNIKTHIANCCLPVPGDEITGFITKTNGISVHRISCPNIDLIDDKIVEVSWNNETKNKYLSELIVYTNSGNNIMLDLVQTIINNNMQPDNVNIINKTDKITYSVIVQVNNIEELEKLKTDFMKIKGVTDIERVTR